MPGGVRIAMGMLSSPRLKSGLWRRWYRYLDRRMEHQPVRFLNYGLAMDPGEAPALKAEDEPDRDSIQLYHRVAGAVSLAGAAVLEVSCGRGGGAEYLSRYLQPREVVALDRTESALGHARRACRQPGVEFVGGDALALPFGAGLFDAVVNVEASHCYPDVPAFLAEVKRVLKPGGALLYADFRREKRLDAWHEQIRASGLRVVEEEEITPRVVESLVRTHEQKASLIRQIAPRWLRSTFLQFAGSKQSVMFRAFEKRRARYLRFVLCKS